MRSSPLPRVACATLAVLLAACAPPAETPRPAAAPGQSVEFEGSWNAAGTRRTLALGDGRRSSVFDLRGTLLLTGSGRPGVGFHVETIAFTAAETGLIGRSVWTDERGDRVFSELKGEGTAAKNRITGTIVGGTGRFAGATGSYEFTWQYVIEAEDGVIQGRGVGLKGRALVGAAGGARP